MFALVALNSSAGINTCCLANKLAVTRLDAPILALRNASPSRR